MRRPTLFTTISLLVSLPFVLCDANAGVALASFKPAINPADLSNNCRQIYEGKIMGCVVSDFQPPNDCSPGCIAGLILLDTAVMVECFSDNVDASSILGYFKRGQGIQALCDIAVITTSAVAGTVATVNSATGQQQTGGGPKSTVFISPVSMPTSLPSSIPQSSNPSSHSTITMAIPTTTRISSKSTSSLATPTPQQANSNSNPSKPNCNGTNQGSGSPFDSFTDQLCSEGWKLRGSAAWSMLGTVVIAIMWG